MKILMTLVLLIGLLPNDSKRIEAQYVDYIRINETGWEVVSVKDSILYFRNGESFDTNLFELKYIGQLPSESKPPYLIISGRSCDKCDENISIYIHSPGDGEMRKFGKQERYSYPGKVFDYISDELIFESEFFYGNCIEKYPNSAIWKQRVLSLNNEWDESIFIVQAHQDTLREKQIDGHVIFNNFKKPNACNKVEGIVMSSEP